MRGFILLFFAFIFTQDAKAREVRVGSQEDELLPRLPSFGVIREF